MYSSYMGGCLLNNKSPWEFNHFQRRGEEIKEVKSTDRVNEFRQDSMFYGLLEVLRKKNITDINITVKLAL